LLIIVCQILNSNSSLAIVSSLLAWQSVFRRPLYAIKISASKHGKHHTSSLIFFDLVYHACSTKRISRVSQTWNEYVEFRKSKFYYDKNRTCVWVSRLNETNSATTCLPVVGEKKQCIFRMIFNGTNQLFFAFFLTMKDFIRLPFKMKVHGWWVHRMFASFHASMLFSLPMYDDLKVWFAKSNPTNNKANNMQFSDVWSALKEPSEYS
jgi:hypothetical protein